jgi:hypothetical protein
MKKLLTIAVLGGLFAATTLQAQVSIYIVGSTAFRANAIRAITNLYGANITGQNDGSAGDTLGHDVTGKGAVTFSGTIPNLFGGSTVLVKCFWTGSVQGIHTLLLGDTINYFANATAGSATIDAHSGADIAFSDCYQDSTAYSSGITGTAITDTNVAILPFCWVRSYANLSTNISNVTMQTLQTALGNGVVPLSFLDGNTNHYGTNVFITGRTKDSGSRVTSDSDNYYNGTPKIYLMDQVTNNIWYKATVNQTVNGANYGPGYTSGGTEAAGLDWPSTQPGIGYLSINDAKSTLSSNQCAIICFNGFLPFTQDTNGVQYATNGVISGPTFPSYADFSPVITGKYSFWCYEHEMTLDGSGSNGKIFYDYMATNGVDSDLITARPVTAIRLSAMHASRNGDGGVITP